MSDTQLQRQWSMKDLYNLLMYDVEKDLLTTNLPTLDEKYKDETEAEKKERLARYNKAIKTFIKRYKAFMGAWKQELKDIKQELLEAYQKQTSQEDEEALSSLEGLFESM